MSTSLTEPANHSFVHEDESVVIDERPERTVRRRVGRIVSIVTTLLAIVLLWPAQYGGFTGLTVVNGHSMEPTYHTGDLVLSLKLPSYADGDILSYLVPAGQPGAGGRVIHRVASIAQTTGGPVYTTQGDNNPSSDPWHFGTGDVLGKAVFMIPGVGSVLGGSGTPVLMGLASGLAVASFLWRFGSNKKSSTKKDRRHVLVKTEARRGRS